MERDPKSIIAQIFLALETEAYHKLHALGRELEQSDLAALSTKERENLSRALEEIKAIIRQRKSSIAASIQKLQNGQKYEEKRS